jgi:hypothetical protein
MLPWHAKTTTFATLVLMAACAVVHVLSIAAAAQTSKAKKKSEPAPAAVVSQKSGVLPAPVAEMRDGILEAVRSGRIEDLKVPIAWNELPPTFSTEKIDDPIAYFKTLSTDGEGREILAVLAALLDTPPVVLPTGRDVENSRLYVWPRYAEMALDKLSPEDEVQLYRLIQPSHLKSMREKKRWTWWRLAIGADGTWHSFQKQD